MDPPITFVVSANCGRYCGVDVDFVDIDPETGLMSVKKIVAKLKDVELKGNLPKVEVPVHLCETSCDMSSISELADHYGFSVLETLAMIGGYKGQLVGSCIHSQITVFSFHPVKLLQQVKVWLRPTTSTCSANGKLRSHGITKDFQCFEYSAAGPGALSNKNLVITIV